jgi:hypothetical protein
MKNKENPLANLIPEEIYLSPEDMQLFLDTLDRPPEPNKKLKALMHNEKYTPDCPPHKYIKNTTSGIGFCEICYDDNINSDIHKEYNDTQK